MSEFPVLLFIKVLIDNIDKKNVPTWACEKHKPNASTPTTPSIMSRDYLKIKGNKKVYKRFEICVVAEPYLAGCLYR